MALELDSDYATSPKLLMSFLRAVEGQPKQAAKRLARHFETKLDLFGRDKLVKDIEISDLDEYDMIWRPFDREAFKCCRRRIEGDARYRLDATLVRSIVKPRTW